MISIHLSSFSYAVGVFLENFVVYDPSSVILCKVACYLAEVGWCFFRATKLLLYYQRLAVLVNTDVYSQWVGIISRFLACNGLVIVLPTVILLIHPTTINAGDCVH